MLKVSNLSVHYGGIHALKGVSFEVKEGQMVTLIGSNGAGKSTILNALSRVTALSGGTITFLGKDLGRMASEKVVGLGMVQVPEGRRIFTRLNVDENLLMGAYLRRDHRGIQEDLAYVYRLFPRLKERARQMGGTLSGGEQQMLAIGRAILAKPRLLMLDEPSMGLAPMTTQEIFQTIHELKDKGLTVLLVEQNASLALEHSDVGYVIETGQIVMTGSSRDLLRDDGVRKAYLGEE